MILVIGATGKIGGEAARLLAESGANVRALARDLARAQRLAELGIQLAQGDLADKASLDRAMAGVDRILLVSAQDLRQAELQGNAVAAAARASVRTCPAASGRNRNTQRAKIRS